ncbi:MAG: HAD family phosphatase [Desulfomonilia bacterium]|jgi:FMN phosphatase YigB (HAD superfamily)
MKRFVLRAALFDFGGVIADEGFKNGLHEIARANGLPAEEFEETARELIHETGYITGTGTEASFWESLRSRFGITGSDEELRSTILKGFIVRKWMIDVVEALKSKGIRLAVLSDQTDWLDELDRRTGFSRHFEQVFNSYRLGRTKREKELFLHVLGVMHLVPDEVLFVDDTEGHVKRAVEVGLHAIHYQGKEDFLRRLSRLYPEIAPELERLY